MMGNPEICVDSEIEDELTKIKEKVPEMIYVHSWFRNSHLRLTLFRCYGNIVCSYPAVHLFPTSKKWFLIVEKFENN